MASLTVTTAQVAEMRSLIDPRATIKVLPDNLFTVDLTLGAATDWAWLETRGGRSDAAGEASDFATFHAALTALETSHFNRAVFYRTAGLVASSYREVQSQDAGGIRQDYGGANTEADLNRHTEREIELLREVSPAGTYSKTVYTLFAIN